MDDFTTDIFGKISKEQQTVLDVFSSTCNERHGEKVIIGHTPSGKSHFYELWKQYKESTEWMK